MKMGGTKSLTTLVLLLVNGLLIASLTNQWMAHSTGSQDIVEVEQVESSGISEGFKSLSKRVYRPQGFNNFTEILERPLFTIGRIPPEEPAEQKNMVAQMRLDLQLEGIAVAPDSRIAVVSDTQTREIIRLSEGMDHKGWTVQEISTGSVVFNRGGERQELILEVEKNPLGANKAIIKGGKPVFALPPSRTKKKK